MKRTPAAQLSAGADTSNRQGRLSEGGSMRSILLVLAIVLLLAWVGSFVVYHVAGFLIHLLLVVAIVSFVFSLFMGKRAV